MYMKTMQFTLYKNIAHLLTTTNPQKQILTKNNILRHLHKNVYLFIEGDRKICVVSVIIEFF